MPLPIFHGKESTDIRPLMHGVFGGGDSHLEGELAKRIANPDVGLGATSSDNMNVAFKRLERELSRLTNVSRDLGASVGLVDSSTNLRKCLNDVRRLLHKNASDLFPTAIKDTKLERQEATNPRWEDLPESFKCLVKYVDFLTSCLNDFSDFTDETLFDALSDLTDGIRYVSQLLNQRDSDINFGKRCSELAMKKYVQDLSNHHLIEPMGDVANSLNSFIDNGVKAIKFAQNQSETRSLTITSLATFFSAVSATTLQFSFMATSTTLEVTVNSFWFCSLVFSIASVANGLLAYMWKSATYRSPMSRTPMWFTVWLTEIPLLSLIASAVTFAVGLCVFAYSSTQNIITSTLTSLLTGISSVGLMIATLWFVLEKMVHSNHKGRVWLIQRIPQRFHSFPILSWALSTSSERTSHIPQTSEGPLCVISIDHLETNQNGSDSTQSSPSTSEQVTETEKKGIEDRMGRIGSLMLQLDRMGRLRAPIEAHETFVRHMQFSPDGKYLATCSWDKQVKIYNTEDFRKVFKVLDHREGPEWRRHEFLRHVAWSPGGDKLLCQMLRGLSVWNPITGAHICDIRRDQPIESAIWFPPPSLVGHSIDDAVALLSVEGAVVRKLTVNKPGGETSEEYKIKDSDTVIHDLAVMPDSTRIICVATRTLHLPVDGDQVGSTTIEPVECREEMILLYNLNDTSKELEETLCMPVVGESRNVKLSKDGKYVLVSYENKTPPQIWELRAHGAGVGPQLVLEKTLMPKKPVDFAGPSQFGGSDEELVICAGKDGAMYVWDSRTGFLLHEFDTRDRNGECPNEELTSLAWNHDRALIFCTGHVNGAVKVWTSTRELETKSKEGNHNQNVKI